MQYSIPITQKLRKLVRSLNQKQHRDSNHIFMAEGDKLCREAYHSAFQTELLVVRDSPSADVLEVVELFANDGIPIYNAPKHVFDQMVTTRSPQGIVAVITKKDLPFNPNENTIILDGINDPGNLGTIIRTAEWFGIKQIAIGNDATDHYNPKAIRSSMGSVFRVPIAYFDNLEAAIEENFNELEIFGAVLSANKNLVDCNPKGKFAVVLGSESHGISESVKKLLSLEYLIPGKGMAESLNVAVAAGISFSHFSKFVK